MTSDDTEAPSPTDAATRSGRKRDSGRRQARHELAVVQAEIHRMHRRAAWASRPQRAPAPDAAPE